jgi:signal transduction histidine kinase
VEVNLKRAVLAGQERLLALVRDITERKETQEALMKFERLSTIGEMAAGLAHEIRNPLASISTAAQLLKRRAQKDKDGEDPLADTILEQSNRLEQLVRDTMDYARSEKSASLEPFPLRPALESAVRLCQVQFGPSHSKVRVEWGWPKEDLRLTANPQRIQQVLINLILNAYQAMPEGGTLRIGMEKVGDRAHLRVEDSGPGIKDEDLRRLFEPFFTTKVGGSGLGLAISRRIAAQYGGKIRVERLSKGTAFILEIPLAGEGAA